MSVATGSKSGLNFKEETTYATPPSGNWEQLSFNNESLQESINQITSNEIKQDRTLGSVRGGNIMAGGNFSMDYYSSKIGFWLKHALAPSAVTAAITISAIAAAAVTRGTYVTSNAKTYIAMNDGTVTSGDVTTGLSHTSGSFTLGAVEWLYVGASGLTINSHTIAGNPLFPTGGVSFEKRIRGSTADTYFPIIGCRVNELSLNIPQEGIISVDVSLLGQKFSSAATSSIAGTPVEVADDPVTGAQAEVRVNSIVQVIVQAATLRIANNFDANVFVIGNRFRKDLPPGRREVSGTFTAYFEDLTAYNLFKNETVVPIRYSFLHNGNYSEINLPECKIIGGSPTPQIAGNGTVTSTFNFQGFKDSGSYDIQAVLKNQLTGI